MRTKGLRSSKVNVVTMGCAKNLVDSEVLLTQLKANKIDAGHESLEDDADIVIINTCGFIDSAKQESIDTILRYAEARECGQIDKLYVTGCLSQRYKSDLEKEIPLVDAYFGTNELPRLLQLFKADYKHELLGDRQITTPTHYAYMKISEGCDRPCAFCAIPLMRGKHVSRNMDDLVLEATNLANSGVKELLLISQDSTYYGMDLYGKRVLSELLRKLSDVAGLEWIRLHYAFPTGFPLDILKVMRSRENICKYLDIPLQHGSSRMLKIMRRGTTRERTKDLLATIRDSVPNIAIRTTLIVGHPGETDQDFEEMMEFVEESRFDRLGVFTYSHEQDTHSFSMHDGVPQELKQKRADYLMELQQGISVEINNSKIGNRMKVHIDREESSYWIGRTEYDSPEVDNEVMVMKEDGNSIEVRPGSFLDVEIVDATEFDLIGRFIRLL